jgi:hypothetical protein
MKEAKPNPNSLSLAGEFATLSQLALKGYDANMTLGNTKGVDILVSDPASGAMYRLEVKASSYLSAKGSVSRRSKLFGYNYEWLMGKKHETIIDPLLFCCSVNLTADGSPFQHFVVPSADVAAYVKAQHQVWLDQDPTHEDTNIRNFRLALDEENRVLPIPCGGRYGNDWGFNA